jgi:pimeloyl-ACP methyl ester carboxylesterase
MTQTMAGTSEAKTTRTLDVPGVQLTYDVRRSAQSSQPPLMLIGSPMGASGFETLGSHFGDRTVITYDPRGVERSTKTDAPLESTPEQHADDISAVIDAVGEGSVDLFASSGGAINALALVAKHPEQVRTLVAHEPPTTQVLPDREAAMDATQDIYDTYMSKGTGPAMAKFIAIVSFHGEIPADYTSQPAADPQIFGLPAEDDGSREDVLLRQNIISCTQYQPDFDSLRSASTRIVLAAGEESAGQLAHRGALGVARELGHEVVMFPSDHGGFLGGEYGQMGKPTEFAAKLREVLSQA